MFKMKWVPMPIIEQALIEKKHNEIELFLYLKMLTSGRFSPNRSIIRSVLNLCQITESTFYRRLSRLKEWDWIGYDKQYEVYYVRGFKRLYQIEGFLSRTAVLLQVEDLYNFQVFCFSACIGLLLRNQNKKERRGTEQKSWCSNQSPSYSYKPVAISVMQSLLSISKDTAITLKKESIKSGYLSSIRDYKALYHVKYHTPMIYKIYPQYWGLLRREGCMISLIQPDLFRDNHKYKRKNYK